MADSLLRLVYISTATSKVDGEALNAILATSGERNRQSGITGMLCAGSEHYMQVLEGPADTVMKLYLRIMDDSRHRDLTLLSVALVAERLFAHWAMAHIEGSARSPVLHEILLGEHCAAPRNDRAAAILRRFVAALKDREVSAPDPTPTQ